MLKGMSEEVNFRSMQADLINKWTKRLIKGHDYSRGHVVKEVDEAGSSSPAKRARPHTLSSAHTVSFALPVLPSFFFSRTACNLELKKKLSLQFESRTVCRKNWFLKFKSDFFLFKKKQLSCAPIFVLFGWTKNNLSNKNEPFIFCDWFSNKPLSKSSAALEAALWLTKFVI